MTTSTFTTLLCAFAFGGYLLVSAEEKKMGPFKFSILGIEPRSFDLEGAAVHYTSELKPMHSHDKHSDKRFWIKFKINRKIAPIGANVTLYSDESGSKKLGHWNKQAEYDVGLVCDADYGVNVFFDSISPSDVLDRGTCGIPEPKPMEVGNWTIDDDLHDALDECQYGWYRVDVCLSDKLINPTTQYCWDEDCIFLKFSVFGEISDAREKKKKSCKKDDEDCKEKEKKKKKKKKEKDDKDDKDDGEGSGEKKKKKKKEKDDKDSKEKKNSKEKKD